MIITPRIRPRLHAIATAGAWLTLDPLFLDTETTGLDRTAQICDLAVIAADGEVLIDTPVKPTHSIPLAASRLHHIDDFAVRDAPTFAQLYPQLLDAITGRHVLIYNALFDLRLIIQSARAHHIPPDDRLRQLTYCAMVLYAQFRGEWSDYRQDWRWHKLEDAARHCGITAPQLHRARADADLCRQVVLHIAAAKA